MPDIFPNSDGKREIVGCTSVRLRCRRLVGFPQQTGTPAALVRGAELLTLAWHLITLVGFDDILQIS
jgi:hypothetical protein